MAGAPAALQLSPDEVQRLLEDQTPAAIIDVTRKIAGAYGDHGLTGNEAAAAEQIFRLLMRETEIRVRVALAEQLKDSAQIPRDIVMSLARDVEEVSLPILQYSEVLTDDDLIDLLSNTQEITRYLAVSKREFVSDTVSDTLLARGNDEVTQTLVCNNGAQISEASLQQLVEKQAGNDALMRAMSQRPQLPLAVTEKMIHVVSSSLAETLKKKYNAQPAQIEQEVEKTREGETLGLVRQSRSQEEIDKLVSQLQTFQRLTPSIILSALCQGNFAFFETSLARLANIPVTNARKLIGDRGELGFRGVYNKSGLPDALFPAVRLLLKVVRELDSEGEKPGSSRYPNRIVERVLQYSEESPIENLSYIIALVRRVGQ